MFRAVSTAAFVGLLAAGAASAQTATTPSATTPPPAMAPAPMAGATTFITDQGVGQYRASKFIGLNVYGPENAKVGDINEIIIDGTGMPKAIVIGVGGFLGIGEKNVAVPFTTLTWVNTRHPTVTASLGGVTNPGPVAAPTANATDPNAGTTARPARTPAEDAAYNGYPDHATIALTKADLQNAPVFKYFADTHPSAMATTTPMTPPVLPGSAATPAPKP